MSARRFLWRTVALGGIAALACSDSTQPDRVASLAVSPDPIVVVRNDSVQLSVSALDGNGHLVTGVSVVFSSEDPSLVTVTALGLVRSEGPVGSTEIRVQGGGILKLVPVTVTQVPVAVVLAPADTSIRQGGSFQYRAHVVDGLGDSIPGLPITFTWSDSTMVTVSATGFATAIGPPGGVLVIARNGPRAASATITVQDTSIVARLPLGHRPYGIAVLNDIAYISRIDIGRVQVLSLTSLTFIDSIAVGAIPCEIAINRAGTTAYVANQGSQNVSIINVASRLQTGVIPLHGDPVPVEVSPSDSVLFVTTNADKLFKINLRTNAVVDSLPLPATSHHLLAHPNDTLVYVATREGGSVLEVNWRTMTVARTFTLGGMPQELALAPDKSELYVANEQGVVNVITLATGVIANIPVSAGTADLSLNADGSKLYVGLLFAGRIQVIDRVTRTLGKTIVTGGVVRQMRLDPVRGYIIVTNESGWVDIVR